MNIENQNCGSPCKEGGFPGGSDGKEYVCSVGDWGLIPKSGRSPGGGHGNPLQYSCLEKPPWTEEPGGLQSMGSQESDMTERLSTAQHVRRESLQMKEKKKKSRDAQGILRRMQHEFIFLIIPTGSDLSLSLETK